MRRRVRKRTKRKEIGKEDEERRMMRIYKKEKENGMRLEKKIKRE